jgi:flagellar motor switch protein FliG
MELVSQQSEIEKRIFSFQNIQVMIDRDLAEMYGVDTKVLNQAIKRNMDRFPDSFRFQLTKNELDELVANCDRFKNLKHSSVLPYTYDWQG